MTYSFNLLLEPWIPLTDIQGKSVQLGLWDTLLRAQHPREIRSSYPLETAALYRLLLAVLHRVYGPPDVEEWDGLWAAGRWEPGPLEAYLGRHRDRFDLFHPRYPFMQRPDERVPEKGVSKLAYQFASGNNPTLFDHNLDDGGLALEPARAARLLLAAMSFGLGGLSGLRERKFTDCPAARSVLFMVLGDTLFETLALNLLRYPDSGNPWPQAADDRPAWEMDDPCEPDREWPLGYLDYLTWHNRRILLFPTEENGRVVVRTMTEGPGLRLSADLERPDPMVSYSRGKRTGYRPLSFRPGRALWRDSSTLLRRTGEAAQAPRIFDWLAELELESTLPEARLRRTLALGMATDPGKQKVFFFRSEQLPLPTAYLLEDDLVQRLDQAILMVEAAARQLWGATASLATEILAPGKDRRADKRDVNNMVTSWAVEPRYWPGLEIPFHELLVELPTRPEALAGWQKTISQTAWSAFDQVADNLGRDPVTLRAVVTARDQLAAGLAKALPRANGEA